MKRKSITISVLHNKLMNVAVDDPANSKSPYVSVADVIIIVSELLENKKKRKRR